MQSIIQKLNQIREPTKDWDTWSLEEKKQLLKLYYIISKNEHKIFDMIYSHHSCDSWEDIFRDYDQSYLDDKTQGVRIAINYINAEIHENDEDYDSDYETLDNYDYGDMEIENEELDENYNMTENDNIERCGEIFDFAASYIR